MYNFIWNLHACRSAVGTSIDTKIRMKVVIGVMALFMVLQVFNEKPAHREYMTGITFVLQSQQAYGHLSAQMNASAALFTSSFPEIVYAQVRDVVVCRCGGTAGYLSSGTMSVQFSCFDLCVYEKDWRAASQAFERMHNTLSHRSKT